MADQVPDWVNYRPVKWEKCGNTIDTRNLSPQQKHQLSNGLKKANPAKADMLKNDPAIAQLKKLFNARIVFDETEFNSLMKQGKEQ